MPLNERETELLIQEATIASGGDKNSVSFELFKKVMLSGG